MPVTHKHSDARWFKLRCQSNAGVSATRLDTSELSLKVKQLWLSDPESFLFPGVPACRSGAGDRSCTSWEVVCPQGYINKTLLITSSFVT